MVIFLEATPLYLSDYLGVASGSYTTVSYSPYMTINQQCYAFGADRPGNYSTNKISFQDRGIFNKGIGAHSASSILFYLNPLRAIQSFSTFETIVGIDVSGGYGTRFKIYLDGVLVENVVVSSVSAPSIYISVDVTNATTLSLVNEDYGPRGGNHSAWADAKLTGSVPEPANFLLALVMVSFLLYKKL